MNGAGAAKTEVTVGPIAVKNLNLPPEIEPVIQKIADAGPTTDLDTVEEFRLAKQELQKITTPTKVVIVGNNIYYPSIEEIKSFLGLTGTRNVLVQQNIRTGEKVFISKDVRMCGWDPGAVTEVISDGRGVYVMFQKTRSSGWFGKVVEDEGGRKIIRFVIPTAPVVMNEMVIEGGRVFAAGRGVVKNAIAIEALDRLTPVYSSDVCDIGL